MQTRFSSILVAVGLFIATLTGLATMDTATAQTPSAISVDNSYNVVCLDPACTRRGFEKALRPTRVETPEQCPGGNAWVWNALSLVGGNARLITETTTITFAVETGQASACRADIMFAAQATTITETKGFMYRVSALLPQTTRFGLVLAGEGTKCQLGFREAFALCLDVMTTTNQTGPFFMGLGQAYTELIVNRGDDPESYTDLGIVVPIGDFVAPPQATGTTRVACLDDETRGATVDPSLCIGWNIKDTDRLLVATACRGTCSEYATRIASGSWYTTTMSSPEGLLRMMRPPADDTLGEITWFQGTTSAVSLRFPEPPLCNGLAPKFGHCFPNEGGSLEVSVTVTATKGMTEPVIIRPTMAIWDQVWTSGFGSLLTEAEKTVWTIVAPEAPSPNTPPPPVFTPSPTATMPATPATAVPTATQQGPPVRMCRNGPCKFAYLPFAQQVRPRR